MVGGMCKIRQDFPPYMLGDMVEGTLKVIGPNVVGLNRRGFKRDVLQALKEAHRFIYRDGLNRSQALLLRKYVHQADPHAFMIITASTEIVGKGFLKS